MASVEQSTVFRGRRWYQKRNIRFLIVVGALLVLFMGYGFVTGPARISDALKAQLDHGPKTVNIEVTAKFPPEAFHMGVYQELGAVRGNKGRTTTLFRVKPADVKKLSRRYWIERIDLAPAVKKK